jgi:hypothetical protein
VRIDLLEHDSTTVLSSTTGILFHHTHLERRIPIVALTAIAMGQDRSSSTAFDL